MMFFCIQALRDHKCVEQNHLQSAWSCWLLHLFLVGSLNRLIQGSLNATYFGRDQTLLTCRVILKVLPLIVHDVWVGNTE